jgi:hypothetical protein
VREAWRRSETHTEIGKDGGCGLFLYSRRRQKEGAEGRETNNGKGGGGGKWRADQGRGGQDNTQPNYPRPKTRPKLYAEREKGSLPARRRSHLVLAGFSFCVAISIYAATSGCLYRVPGRSARDRNEGSNVNKRVSIKSVQNVQLCK